MKRLQYKVVDVFTATPFKGNPVAVILDAQGMSTQQMQQVANWLNLSETTFVIAPTLPDADYGVRIFTPLGELPFAGHPTLGTAHALLEAKLVRNTNGLLIQQCPAGLISLKIEDTTAISPIISFGLPTAAFHTLTSLDIDELDAILECSPTRIAPPYVVDVGPRWIVVQLASAAEVIERQPDLQRLRRLNQSGAHTGLVIFGAHDKDVSKGIEVRAFAPAHNVNEDPVCGSGNGSIAAYLLHTGQITSSDTHLTATQGRCVGRAGSIHLRLLKDEIRVGGNAVTCMEGTTLVPSL